MAQYLHTTWPPRVKIGLKGQEHDKGLGEGAGDGPVPIYIFQVTTQTTGQHRLKGQEHEKI